VDVHWQLKPSVLSQRLIIVISLLPLTLSIIIGSLEATLIIILLTPVFYFLLVDALQLLSANQRGKLWWQDGSWHFSSPKIITEGIQSEQSFTIGLLLLLAIEDESGRVTNLWLFPDSLCDTQRDWRHLQACFQLSGLITVGTPFNLGSKSG